MAADEMILGATIEQLRAYCSPFSGRVAGTADFRQGLVNYNANMPLPAAYVIPLDQESDGDQNMTGLQQIIRKTVGIIVELEAVSDRRGQKPAMQYDEIEAALFSTLLNWAPVECRVPGRSGYQFLGGRFLDLDRARLFYQWEFLLPYTITDEDGWHEPAPDLTGIEVDLYKGPPFEMPPADGRPPAAVIVLGVAPPTNWDAHFTTWDDGNTIWDPATA
jgi:hypothetical protein